MSPMQQIFLGMGAVATKTYVDDVFSTFLYTGNNSSLEINNGIDLSSNGGMVWVKNRESTDSGAYHQIFDTERGRKGLFPNESSAQQNYETGQFANTAIKTFDSDGFTLGEAYYFNNVSGEDHASWTFRKAPGFFDVVTYTGNGNSRTIAHSLGSVPGCIMIKCTSQAQDWVVYHRGSNASPEDYVLRLNDTNAAFSAAAFNNTLPTSTNFSLGTAGSINGNGETYVAYVFAGGESTAATARSVDFDGSDDYLEISSHADLQLGTDDFTLEMWWNGSPSGSYTQCFGTQSQFDAYDGTWRIGTRFNSENRVYFARGNGSGFDEFYYEVNVNDGQWHHIACVRASNIVTIYIDGVAQGTPDWRSSSVPANRSITGTCSSSLDFWVGRQGRPSNIWAEGKMSNIRVVKGTAVYTSSFRPPTEPLTNITNTVVLICNNSSVTGSTVTPGTISSGGSPTASTDSPFDDPAGFVFGENENESAISTGSYIGNGNADGPEIFLGWEPQFLILKGNSDWHMVDCMRGVVTGGNDARLFPNDASGEAAMDIVSFTPTGFKLTHAAGFVNGDGTNFVYMAIRRPDGYVGKPPSLGTGVFAMDTGNSSSTIPTFDSGFPVDFGIMRSPGVVDNNNTGARLTGTGGMRTNGNNAETDYGSQWAWDSNAGWVANNNYQSSTQSWMWSRRGQSFDVVTWTGDGVNGRQIPHSMNKTVEMIWLKRRTGTARNWPVYHKGLDGGSSPEEKVVWLNLTNAESDAVEPWNDTAPTSTHFTIGGGVNTNEDEEDYIAMLFASVDGISKVGSYSGNGSTGQSINVGFTPRFIMIKGAERTTDWGVWDSVRGLTTTASNNYLLFLNTTGAQTTLNEGLTKTNTGFALSDIYWNDANETFIYYAHA